MVLVFIGLGLYLLQNGLLDNDIGNFLIIQVFLAQLQRIEYFLPLCWNFISIKSPCLDIEGDALLKCDHLARMFLWLLLLIGKETFDLVEEASLLLFLLCLLDTFFLDLVELGKLGRI